MPNTEIYTNINFRLENYLVKMLDKEVEKLKRTTLRVSRGTYIRDIVKKHLEETNE